MPRLMRVLGLSLALLATAGAAKGPLDRLMGVKATATDAVAEETSPHAETFKRMLQSDGSVLPAFMPDAEVTTILNAASNGFDGVKWMQDSLKTPAFKRLLAEPEMLHSMMENIPWLGAVQGFNRATGRRLSDADTAAAVQEGFGNLIEAMGKVQSYKADPVAPYKSLANLLNTGGPEIDDLLTGVEEGDQEAVLQLSRMLHAKDFPAFDLDELDFQYQQMDASKLLDLEGVGEILSMDPVMKEALLNPVNPLEYAYKAAQAFAEDSDGL